MISDQLCQLAAQVAHRHRIEPHQIARKQPQALPARKEFVRAAYADGYTTRQIAKALNYHTKTIRKLKNS